MSDSLNKETIKSAALNLESCMFSHIKRESNSVAHTLVIEVFASPVSIVPRLAADLV